MITRYGITKNNNLTVYVQRPKNNEGAYNILPCYNDSNIYNIKTTKMRKNVTQKAMSFKIDLALLPKLEKYCTENETTKNRAINEAIAKMLDSTM